MEDHPEAERMIADFGRYAYGFVSILHKDNPRNSRTEIANEQWMAIFAEHPPSNLDLTGSRIWAMSDNGDYFLELADGRQVILDYRSDRARILKSTAYEVMRDLKELMPDVY